VTGKLNVMAKQIVYGEEARQAALTTEALVSEILERKARAISNGSDIGGTY
jgi:hypothetical protein